jgi:ABC-type amino acid transport substrate-binding protein
MKKHNLYTEERSTLNDIIIPICYIFPCTGKLLTILFVTFAAWYDGVVIDVIQYPEFVITSLLTFIGSANYAIPFLLNHYHISSDLFDIYLMAGVINGKFATLLASIYLFGFTLITTAWLTGFLQIDTKKIIRNFSIIVFATVLTVFGTKIILNLTPKNNNQVKRMLASMKIEKPVKKTIQKEYPPVGSLATMFKSKPGLNRLEIIKKRGVLNVGYNLFGRPFTYFNAQDDLVGLDVAIANMLARDLGCTLNFIPVKINEMDKYLNSGTVDIVMAGISKTVKRIPYFDFTDSYMLITLALVVKDYRVKEFVNTEDLRKMNHLSLAVLKGSSYKETILHAVEGTRYEDNLKFIELDNIEEFYDNKVNADALLTSAEQGAAYCMLYPSFETVVPKPVIRQEAIAYVIAKNDLAFSKYLDEWLAIKKDQGYIKKLRNYWIFGKGVEYKQPRWNLWDMLFDNQEKEQQ